MSQAHTYTSLYPLDITVIPGIRKFFEDFYKASDTPEAHEKYADFFMKDAEFIIGPRRVKGREEIIEMRKSMWTEISSRLHSPLKIFPFGNNSNEVMIEGAVKFGFKEGGGAKKVWAANAKMVDDNGVWKLGFYRVYLDSATVNPNSK